MELILVRHTAVLNPARLCYGRKDLALSPGMELEAGKIRKRIEKWGRHPGICYSSPSARCTSLARSLYPAGIQIDDRLQELDFGIWEDTPWEHIPSSELMPWMDNFVFEKAGGAESYADLQQRIFVFLGNLPPPEDDEVVMLVSHAGPIRAMLAWFLGMNLYDSFKLQVEFGSVHRVKLWPGLRPVVCFQPCRL